MKKVLNLKNKSSLKSVIFGAIMVCGSMIGTNEAMGANTELSRDDNMNIMKDLYYSSSKVKRFQNARGDYKGDFIELEKVVQNISEEELAKIKERAKKYGSEDFFNFLVLLKQFLDTEIKVGNSYQTVFDILVEAAEIDTETLNRKGFSDEQIKSFSNFVCNIYKLSNIRMIDDLFQNRRKITTKDWVAITIEKGLSWNSTITVNCILQNQDTYQFDIQNQDTCQFDINAFLPNTIQVALPFKGIFFIEKPLNSTEYVIQQNI